jgi:hypothetical protein
MKILRLIRLQGKPFATATDLQPNMSVGRRQTKNRMDDLVDMGLLHVETVGTTNVYWLSDAGVARLASSDS